MPQLLKPDIRRQRRNARGRERKGLVVFPRPEITPIECPPPPRGLLKRYRDSWQEFWRSKLAGTADPVTDLPAIERLWTLYDERERAYRGYRRERLVIGSHGQPVLNPLGRVISVCDAEIRALEDRLGLNPRARMQLGIALSEAAKSIADLNRALEKELTCEPEADIEAETES